MQIVKNYLFHFYFFIFTLYIFLNKGVAYTYLVEALWLFGILLLLMDRKKVELVWNKTTKLILFFIVLWDRYSFFLITKFS